MLDGMPERSRTYINFLTPEDRLAVRKVTNGRQVVEFSVQYDALIHDCWHKITRYDNAHGKAHRHVYYADGSVKRFEVDETDHNLALTEAYETIKITFQWLREQYIIRSERNRS